MSLCPHDTSRLPLDGFYDIVYLSICRKAVEKIQVSLNSNKNKGYFTRRPIYILIISLSFLLRMRNVASTSCRENENTHFMLRNFFLENHAVYEIIWKNTVEPERPQMTTYRMRISYWVSLAKNTLGICNINCFFATTMVTRKRLYVSLYVHCLSFYFSLFSSFLFLCYHPFSFVSLGFSLSTSIVSQSSSLCVARRSSAHFCNIFNRNVPPRT
jgi:hypothetical protein